MIRILRTIRLIAVPLFVLTAMVATAVAQVPQRDARPAPATSAVPAAPTGTATVSGKVVADATGASVGLATVVLIGTRSGVLKVTSADREGAFTFSALPADRYTVGASKLPYLGAVAGARRPARPGSAVIVADAATVSDVTIRLPMGAALSGTIYDESGRPALGVPISVLQRRMQNGERSLVRAPAAGVTTNDLGHYRVFGLPPGEYLISASGTHQPVPARVLTDAEVDAALASGGAGVAVPLDDATAVAPVYYPGTTRATDATGVLLAAGEDKQGLDFRLERVRPVQIEGTITTADGSPLPGGVTAMLRTVTGSSAAFSGVSTNVSPQGRFYMPGQAPGRYALSASVRTGTTTLSALSVIDTVGNDAVSVQLVLRPALTLSGRLAASVTGGAKQPTLSGLRLQLVGLGPAERSGFGPEVSPAGVDGTFTMAGVMPGRFTFGGAPFFGASADSVTWGLATVTVGGTDVTDRAFDISAETPPTEIVATLTNQWQEITGRVTNAEGAGVSDYTMLVFPADEAYWLHNSRRIVTTQPAGDGRYALGGPGPALLPAGEYYLAAVTDVSKDEQYDPAFLKALIPAAIKITLGAGQKATQDIRVQ